MSVRLEMLRAVRRSLSQLGDSSALVGERLRSQTRSGGRVLRPLWPLRSVLHGLRAGAALGSGRAHAAGNGLPTCSASASAADLDLVHLCCLIRCRASAGIPASSADSAALAARLESHRTPDGGYDSELGAPTASAYGCFLVAMAYEDLGVQVPSRDTLLQCLRQLRARDGGFANQPNQALGLTPTTAAIATLLRSLGENCPPGLEAWLLSQRHPESGFYAVPGAPIPDLLSTATALHALSCMGVSLDLLREPCLDFVRSLWTGDGAFAGSWADPTPDCEYTYYGLLALGHLSP